MGAFHLSVGDATSFSKTVGEFDVYGFAGITGDFAPNRVYRAYMEKSGYGGLIAHGALLVGYMTSGRVTIPAFAALRRGAIAVRITLKPAPYTCVSANPAMRL